MAGILEHGFWDATGSYMMVGIELTGVWISDEPLNANEGFNVVLTIDLSDSVDLTEYEIIEELKPYREWCVPAEILNAGTVRHVGTIWDYWESEDARRRSGENARQGLKRSPGHRERPLRGWEAAWSRSWLS